MSVLVKVMPAIPPFVSKLTKIISSAPGAGVLVGVGGSGVFVAVGVLVGGSGVFVGVSVGGTGVFV